MQLAEAQTIKYKDTLDKLCRAVFGATLEEAQTVSADNFTPSFNLISEVYSLKMMVEPFQEDRISDTVAQLIVMDSRVQTALHDYVKRCIEPDIKQDLQDILDIQSGAKLDQDQIRDLCQYIESAVHSTVHRVIEGGELRVSFNNSNNYY